MRVLRIATRASQLALWQANHVADLIRRTASECSVELVHVTTTGDRVQSEVLRQLGTLGVFTREVQHAVLEQRADIAVHSLKDLPTEPTPGLVLAGIPERAVPYDALVLPRAESREPRAESRKQDSGFRIQDSARKEGRRQEAVGSRQEADRDSRQNPQSVVRNPQSESSSEPSTLNPQLSTLPHGARVGTGSLRRQAQLRHWRPDLVLEECRGNVDTRLRKLDEGQFDALILAVAGLTRLGWQERVSHVLQPPLMYPAVSQGAIGIECRADDAEVIAILGRLTDPATQASVLAERSLLAALRAGCHAPLGVQTRIDGSRMTLEAVVLSPDGRQRLLATAEAAVDDAVPLGAEVARRLHDQGAHDLIEAARFEK